MAIHPVVLFSPDRLYRITADPAGTTFTVEYQLVLVGTFTNLPALQRFLHDQGLDLADLVQD